MVLFDTNPIPLHHHRALYHGEGGSPSSPTIDATQQVAKKSRVGRKRRGVSFAQNLVDVVEDAKPWTDKEKRKSFYSVSYASVLSRCFIILWYSHLSF